MKLLTNPKDYSQTITTGLTLEEAGELVAERMLAKPGDTFLEMLVEHYPWKAGSGREFWGYKVAEQQRAEKENPTAGKAEVGSFKQIYQMFESAKDSGLKRGPRIKIKRDGLGLLDLKPGAAGGKHDGKIHVCLDRQWLGSLNETGEFDHRGRASKEVLEFLKDIAQNTKDAVVAHGRLTGNCCFCGTELTKSNSVEAGYGPICAARYGLPW